MVPKVSRSAAQAAKSASVAAGMSLVVTTDGVKMLGLISDKLGLVGGLWDAGALNGNFDTLGFIICGFIAAWAPSYVSFKAKRHDRIDVPVA